MNRKLIVVLLLGALVHGCSLPRCQAQSPAPCEATQCDQGVVVRERWHPIRGCLNRVGERWSFCGILPGPALITAYGVAYTAHLVTKPFRAIKKACSGSCECN